MLKIIMVFFIRLWGLRLKAIILPRHAIGRLSAQGDTRLFAMVIIVVVFICASFARNEIWYRPLLLWRDVAAKKPLSSRVHCNLGASYMTLGMNKEALEEFHTALSLNKHNIDAYQNMAYLYEDIGNVPMAIYYYKVTCKYHPDSTRNKIACDRVVSLTRELEGLQ
jgi:tetratricopeptide (TPR) repeat protein